MLFDPRYGWTIFAAVFIPVVLFYVSRKNDTGSLLLRRRTGGFIVALMLLTYIAFAYLQPKRVSDALLVPQALSKSIASLDCSAISMNDDHSLKISGELLLDGVKVHEVSHLKKGQLEEFGSDVYGLLRRRCNL